ncbi:hypothetical protein COCON_G00049060 [Conger conger]|uniref:Ermin n=1 Tax=Conger conger TaxID=82655 RepID=A0A9Q1I3L6_CONCO|nr:uncharacterized protein LOC133124971 [Conger conger]KAJ8282387.1 hypothetical protein COCON_G00049060 [Conger conger]
MAERTDATLLDLVGSASLTGVVEIIGGAGDIQSLVNVAEATADALEEDDDGDVFFCKSENVSPGISPRIATLALGPNNADTSEPVTEPVSNTSPLETEALFGASYSSADPLYNQSKCVQSENRGTPLNLVDSTKPLEDSCIPTAQNPGETEAKSSAGLPGLVLVPQKGEEEVTSMDQMAQEVTLLAASVPVLEKEGQVNGEEKAPIEGPGEELVSESQDEFEEDEFEEEEDVTEGAQQESSLEGSHSSQGVQSSGEMPPRGSQKTSTSHRSSAKYNTVSYRKIRKGNTKQRIDEFESMMHL